MGDEAHVGLVDAHAEGDRSPTITISSDGDEGRLVARAHRRLEPGMIGQRRAARPRPSCSAIFSALSRLGA